MDWLKKTLFGGAVGSYYAFVSFYLLSPGSEFYLLAIVFFGLQGMLFVVAYKTIYLFCNRFMPFFKQGINLAYHVMAGAISGIISGSFNIIVTYNTQVIQQHQIVPDELKRMVIRDLLQYSIGCILAGISIGCLVCYIGTHRGQK